MHFLLLLVLGLILWPILHRSLGRKETVVCRNCGSIGKPITVSPRSVVLEIILWFAGLFPGVVYTLYCSHVTYDACAKCRSRDIVPVDSPVGRKMAGDAPIDVTPISEDMRRK